MKIVGIEHGLGDLQWAFSMYDDPSAMPVTDDGYMDTVGAAAAPNTPTPPKPQGVPKKAMMTGLNAGASLMYKGMFKAIGKGSQKGKGSSKKQGFRASSSSRDEEAKHGGKGKGPKGAEAETDGMYEEVTECLNDGQAAEAPAGCCPLPSNEDVNFSWTMRGRP
jgi:hypothetical protein